MGATALPIEDTPEVQAAKATFGAAFVAAEAGEHSALAPVNADVQAAQIASAYLDDAAEVAEEKAVFKAAFDDAVAGGLAAKQAPAPVHVITEPATLAAAVVPASGFSYGVSALNTVDAAYPYAFPAPAALAAANLPAIQAAALPAGLTYNGLSGLPFAGYPYAGLPFAGYPYAGLPYAGLPVIAAPVEAEE